MFGSKLLLHLLEFEYVRNTFTFYDVDETFYETVKEFYNLYVDRILHRSSEDASMIFSIQV